MNNPGQQTSKWPLRCLLVGCLLVVCYAAVSLADKAPVKLSARMGDRVVIKSDKMVSIQDRRYSHQAPQSYQQYGTQAYHDSNTPLGGIPNGVTLEVSQDCRNTAWIAVKLPLDRPWEFILLSPPQEGGKETYGWVYAGDVQRISSSKSADIAVQVIVVGVILLVGLAWQGFLQVRDSKRGRILPRRLLPPLAFGVIVMVGVFGYSIICAMHHQKFDSGSMMFKAVVLTAALCLKSFFGPIFNSFLLGIEAYFLLEFGEFRPLPILSAILDWVFDAAPEWLSIVYFVISYVYSLASCTYESVVEN